jgi:KUP system potassium uptake protein
MPMAEDSSTAAAVTDTPDSTQHNPHAHNEGLLRLAVGAIGVVFGDIGTSPLYAFRETFAGHHQAGARSDHILRRHQPDVLVDDDGGDAQIRPVIMRADNKGEGGSLALLALINRNTERRRWTGHRDCWACSRLRCSMATR